LRKSKKWHIITIVFALFLISLCIYKQFIRVQNIFDQIFYDRVQTSFEKLFVGSSFDKMPQIDGVKQWGSTVDYYGEYENNYKKEYLNYGERIYIDCSSDSKVMIINAVKQFDGLKIIFSYTYDVRKKQLTETVECRYGELAYGDRNGDIVYYKEYIDDLQEVLEFIEANGLTKEDLIKYKQYFLYDKLLTDWLDANYSRFSANRWGRVKYIEVLPLESSKQ